MKFRRTIAIAAGLILIAGILPAVAEVDWEVQQTLKLEAPPLDMAVSADGSTIYVLTEGGAVAIYAASGELKGKIETGGQFDRIGTGQNEGFIYLQSAADKTVQVVSLDFIQNIDISGSPFKGSEDAPVAIVVFSDFQ